MPDHHLGRRRRQSRLPIGRLLVLVVALAAVVRVLTLGEPGGEPVTAASPLGTVAPTWSGPAPVDVGGILADGATYTPRVFLTAQTSAGVATSPDGTVRVLLDTHTPGGQAVELRRLNPTDNGQVNGFAFAGDTLVWMETVVRPGASAVTTLWRTAWRSAAVPSAVTANTGEITFSGTQSDVVVQDGRVYWAAVAPGSEVATDIRSVALTGGSVTSRRLDGEFALTTWPFAVSVAGGRGQPVTLVNLSTDEVITVATTEAEVPVCSPTWCRIAVTGQSGLAGIDLVRPDGTGRQRIAGSEATPIIGDATLLDRYVPLATDRGNGGVGLSLYDVATGRTDLVTGAAGTIAGRDGVLWWSTGEGASLVWHAVDLRSLA